jgi:mannose-6-phosphate isomerase-like protein (cupin superfamily)
MPPAGRQSALRFDLDATTRNATMDYNIKTDVKFGPLESFDAGQMSREGKDKWWNQSLCQVNDCVVRLGVFEGEFHWHKHDAEDEVFFVMEGHLFLDLEGRTVELGPHQGITVPRGVLHRTRAPARTVVLMVEAATVKPTGD